MKYVWVKEGSIFIRKDDASRTIKITDEAQLEFLVQKFKLQHQINMEEMTTPGQDKHDTSQPMKTMPNSSTHKKRAMEERSPDAAILLGKPNKKIRQFIRGKSGPTFQNRIQSNLLTSCEIHMRRSN